MEETPTPLLDYGEDAVLDPAMTHQLSAYLGERAVPFVDALLDDLPQLLLSMRDAADQSNFDAIRRDAHTIRGSSGNVGATTLVNLCEKISVACKAGQLDEARLLMASLQSEYEDHVAPAIARLREKLARYTRDVLETQR